VHRSQIQRWRVFHLLILAGLAVWALSVLGALTAPADSVAAAEAQRTANEQAPHPAIPTAWRAATKEPLPATGPPGQDPFLPLQHAPPQTKSTTSGPTDRPTALPRVGFAMNLHHTGQLDAYLEGVDALAEMGCDHLVILVPVFQTHGGATDIAIRPGPGRSPDLHQLTALLRRAEQRELLSVMMPIVLFTDPRGNEWRGKIQPESWDRWWAAYRRVMRTFADLAQRHGVDVLSVGSELLSTEQQGRRWREVIHEVRARYTGSLTYSTNWDHYHVPVFWSELDVMGINAYWDLLPNGGEPTASRLAKRWGRIRDQVLAFAADQDKPLLFTEVGYPSLPWGLKDPWNYVNAKQAEPDPEAQAAGYAAFLSAWGDRLRGERPSPFLAGVTFYKWDPYYRGGPKDTGYGVRGKPAQDLVRELLRQRRR